MTITMFFIFIIIFFATQYLVEKDKMPKWFTRKKLMSQLFWMILILLLSILLGVITKILIIPITATVVLSSIVSAEIRKKHEKVERGSKND